MLSKRSGTSTHPAAVWPPPVCGEGSCRWRPWVLQPHLHPVLIRSSLHRAQQGPGWGPGPLHPTGSNEVVPSPNLCWKDVRFKAAGTEGLRSRITKYTRRPHFNRKSIRKCHTKNQEDHRANDKRLSVDATPSQPRATTMLLSVSHCLQFPL